MGKAGTTGDMLLAHSGDLQTHLHASSNKVVLLCDEGNTTLQMSDRAAILCLLTIDTAE